MQGPSQIITRRGLIKITREELKTRYHSDNHPEIMNTMFDEIVDYVIDHYNFKRELSHADKEILGTKLKEQC